jgi:hypothetical protein
METGLKMLNLEMLVTKISLTQDFTSTRLPTKGMMKLPSSKRQCSHAHRLVVKILAIYYYYHHQ